MSRHTQNRARAGDLWLASVTIVAAATAIFAGLLPQFQIARELLVSVVVQCACIVVGLAIVRGTVGPIHPLSAIAMVTYSQGVLFVARPMYQALEEQAVNPFTGASYSVEFLHASSVSAAGFVAVCVGYGWALRRWRVTLPLSGLRSFSPEVTKRAEQALVASVVVGFLLYAVYVLNIGPSQYWEGLLGGRSAITKSAMAGSTAYFYAGLQFATGSLVLLLLIERVRGRRGPQIAALILIAAAMAPELIGGNRSVFIPVVIAVALTFYSTNRRVFSPLRVLVGLPVVFVLGITAPRIWRDALANGGTFEDSVARAFDLRQAFGGFVGGLDTAMADAFEIQMAAQSSGQLAFQYGQTYIAGLVGFVPRGLWPDKPETVDQVLNESLFPVTDSQGIGFSFGIYSEPYFNFGLIGVLLVGIIAGLTLGVVTKNALKATIPSAFVLIMVISFVFPLMRGSITFDVQRLLITLLPALLALGFSGSLGASRNFLDSDKGAMRK